MYLLRDISARVRACVLVAAAALALSAVPADAAVFQPAAATADTLRFDVTGVGPRIASATLRLYGAERRGRWTSLDVTRRVRGNGRVSIRLARNHRRAVRRGARGPRLLITTARAAGRKVKPPPTPPPPAPSPGTQLQGAQLHPMWSDTSIADFDRELDLLRGAGANLVRIDVAWSSLELHGDNQYSSSYSSKLDTFMQHAAARGIKVLPVIHSTPCWASSAPATLLQDCAGAYWDRDVTKYPPTSAALFADFAAYVATRWGSYMAGLEIWNEPNEASQNFLIATDTAAVYASLLKAAYPAVKAVAPGLPVLGASLSFADGAYLTRLYDLGIKGHFDGIAIHPYNENRDPDIHRTQDLAKWTYIDGVPWIRSIMEARGDADKGIWITEFGFSTCNVATSKWCTTTAQQAEYIKDSIRIAAGWSYVKAVSQYNLRNKGTDPADREAQFGMFQRDFTAKPAWQSFKEALAAY